MAVNYGQRGLLNVATQLQARGGVDGNKLGVMPGTGEQEEAQTAAKAYAGVGDGLSRLSQTIGQYADHAARTEGRREGHLAGLDPEFRPRRDGTIRGEAFDQAGMETLKSRLTVEAENDILGAKDAEEIRRRGDAWLAKVPEDLRPELTQVFRRAELAKSRELTRQAAAQAQAEAAASVETEADTILKGMHQRAYAMGLDAAADAATAADLDRLRKLGARTGPDGKPLLAPQTVEKVIRKAREQVSDARLLGTFSRLASVEEQQAFIAKVEDDFQNGRGLAKEYDLQDFQRITQQLRAQARIAQADESLRRRVDLDTVKQTQQAAERGFLPTDEQMAAFRARAVASRDPEVAQHFSELEATVGFVRSARVARPEELDQAILALRRQVETAGPLPQLVRRIELAEKMRGRMRTQLSTDPLGWSDQVGRIRLEPIDLSTPERARASLTTRIAQAEQEARYYGRRPVYIRPDEAARLSTAAAQGGAAMLDVASRIATYAGPRAQAIIGELGLNAPVVAQIAGHVLQVGETRVAKDAADGMALQKTQPDAARGRLPTVDQAHEAAKAVHGRALSGVPGDPSSGHAETEQALIAATNAAYLIRATRNGWTDFNPDEWKKTFREMIGERRDSEGQVYGGVAQTRRGRWWGSDGGAVIVPPSVRQDGFRALIDSIDPADFGDRPPRWGDGRPATAADLRAATLVQAGNGRYWVNVGTDERPQYLRGETEDERFVLDMQALEPRLKQRRPDLYLGGRRERRSSFSDDLRRAAAEIIGIGSAQAAGVGVPRSSAGTGQGSDDWTRRLERGARERGFRDQPDLYFDHVPNEDALPDIELRPEWIGPPSIDPPDRMPRFGRAPDGAPIEPVVFAGEKSRTADKAALAEAKELAEAGETMHEIWRTTGWMRAPDGKWRSEIDDSGMRLTERGKRLRGGKAQSVTLGEIVEHEALFAAYPRLREMKVVVDPKEPDYAAYDQDTRTISIGRKGLADVPTMLKTIAHEIQHRVQHDERFAYGVQSSSGYRERPGEAEATEVENRLGMSAAQRRERMPNLDTRDGQRVIWSGAVPMNRVPKRNPADDEEEGDAPASDGKAPAGMMRLGGPKPRLRAEPPAPVVMDYGAEVEAPTPSNLLGAFERFMAGELTPDERKRAQGMLRTDDFITGMEALEGMSEQERRRHLPGFMLRLREAIRGIDDELPPGVNLPPVLR